MIDYIYIMPYTWICRSRAAIQRNYMHKKIKLTEYQFNQIRSFLDSSCSPLIEDTLLEKYKVHDISELNATDYDAIKDDLFVWYAESNKKSRGRY